MASVKISDKVLRILDSYKNSQNESYEKVIRKRIEYNMNTCPCDHCTLKRQMQEIRILVERIVDN
jgi:hypothetical protein